MPTERFNLNVIDVPEPCAVPWETMRGDHRVRFCEDCQKHVYHLSNMTRADAERLITEHEGPLCVQFWRRADGTVVTRDWTVVRVAKQAGNALWLILASFASGLLFFVIGKHAGLRDLFGSNQNQIFSQVGGGIGPPRSRYAPRAAEKPADDRVPPPRKVTADGEIAPQPRRISDDE